RIEPPAAEWPSRDTVTATSVICATAPTNFALARAWSPRLLTMTTCLRASASLPPPGTSPCVAIELCILAQESRSQRTAVTPRVARGASGMGQVQLLAGTGQPDQHRQVAPGDHFGPTTFQQRDGEV